MSTMAKQVVDNQKFTGIRLPASVKPSHYYLSLRPDLKKFTFDGAVTIDYKASAQTNEVVLHAVDLQIKDGRCGESQLTQVTYSKDSETATLEFDSSIPHEGSICLNFSGILSEKMTGFYRTSFKLNNETVFAGTTQFEATSARRCLPCWDEPSLKATFSVTITHDRVTKVQGLEYPNVALSNQPVIEEKIDGDLVTRTFDKTPIMSTYLLAFIVGPFEYIEASDGKRQHRVYTTPGKKEQGQFALEVACKSLRYYEDYFNIEYPLKKMDMIAIPDFSSGAMENWGLVTYRESCLLVDPSNTATGVKQNVALVVAHELAHQWFGNLVTMEWWTHLWLNEGFATFMEYLCVDHILPQYDIWSQFTNTHSSALNLDALHNSHPIEVPVNHPSEIDEIFDNISYEKGSAVIRMLYQYIGDDSFRRGMHDYLTKYAYKNAVTEKLWECLEKASDKPVCKVMSCWTSQKGFPWISVESLGKEGGDSLKLSLKQSKFSADGSKESDSTWMIPIDALAGTDPKNPISLGLLEKEETTVVVNGASDSWIKLNPGSIGLYRTAYPENLLKLLLPAISAQTLPAVDRFSLQNDFYALCQAGHVKTCDLLQLLEAYAGETSYTVWTSIDSCVGHLSLLLKDCDFKDKWSEFAIKIYEKIFEKLGWDRKSDELHADTLARPLIINRLVALGHKGVVAEALRKYAAHLNKEEVLPADLRGAVYRAVSVHGNDEAFESLFKLRREVELSEEKNRVSRAFGFTKDPKRLDRVTAYLMSDEVRDQDKIYIFMSLGASNPDVAWRVFKEQKDLFREIYKVGHLLTRLVSFCTEDFTSEEKAQEVSKFFEENSYPGCERTVQQSLEKIRLNANWLARDRANIEAFLSK